MRIGIDLGGTKIEALSLADSGEENGRMRTDTPASNYPALLASICELVAKIEDNFGKARSVGFGTPGSIAPGTGIMQNSNSTVLNGKGLKSDLETRLMRPVRIANDADCFTLSEASDGAAAGYHSVFGVILGTGVGGGLTIGKQLLTGPNALTGEWGHNPLHLEGEIPRDCYCGRKACIESWISGPAVAADHYTQTGTQLATLEIAQSLTADSVATIDRFLERLAKALGQIINVIDPECIVFGGGLSNIDRIYEELPERINRYIMTETCRTQFVKALYGDSSGVRGAAWLWP